MIGGRAGHSRAGTIGVDGVVDDRPASVPAPGWAVSVAATAPVLAPRSAERPRCGSSARTSSRWRSVATSCETWSSSWVQALADGADTLVTSGRRWSNHARLTAAAGARAALAVHLVLSGPAPTHRIPGVRLDQILGATVHVAATDVRAEREALLEEVVEDLRRSGRRPAVIGVGGSGVAGSIGQVLAAFELLDGTAARGFVPDDVVVPSATGGTQAGLLVGLRTGGAATAVHGIAVTPAEELRPKVSGSSRHSAAWTGSLRSRTPRSSSTAPSSARVMAGRRKPRRKPPGSSPGARASSSTRSTRRRPSPASSRSPGRPARWPPRRLLARRGTPGLFEPLGD